VEGKYLRSVQWYKEFQGDKMPHVKHVDYMQLLQLMAYLQQKGQLICKDALNKQGEIIATNVYIKDAKRIYNLLPSSSKEGKELAAMHSLIDNVITENASTNYVFDFEGSNIKGVQQFYLQFGAIPQPYFRLHQNNLPFWLKLIKK
jgi:ADP-glucose pyrophosphorylase